MDREALFTDRRAAGRQLAERLHAYRPAEPVVLALPRGGVVVGFEVAQALEAPLDVVVARKLGAPTQPELGIGAVAPGGVMLVDDGTVAALGLSEDDVARVAEQERAEMERRLRHYRSSTDLPPVEDRTVLLVDDGLATGVTAMAAIYALRKQYPARIVLAVPVCAPETARAMEGEVDELVCLATPARFGAVGRWYRDFDQTTDAEVIELLAEARPFADYETLQEPR